MLFNLLMMYYAVIIYNITFSTLTLHDHSARDPQVISAKLFPFDSNKVI